MEKLVIRLSGSLNRCGRIKYNNTESAKKLRERRTLAESSDHVKWHAVDELIYSV